jgi:hypothetical protein
MYIKFYFYYLQEINCSLNIHDDNFDSHAECYSRQVNII